MNSPLSSIWFSWGGWKYFAKIARYRPDLAGRSIIGSAIRQWPVHCKVCRCIALHWIAPPQSAALQWYSMHSALNCNGQFMVHWISIRQNIIWLSLEWRIFANITYNDHVDLSTRILSFNHLIPHWTIERNSVLENRKTGSLSVSVPDMYCIQTCLICWISYRWWVEFVNIITSTACIPASWVHSCMQYAWVNASWTYESYMHNGIMHHTYMYYGHMYVYIVHQLVVLDGTWGAPYTYCIQYC